MWESPGSILGIDGLTRHLVGVGKEEQLAHGGWLL